MAELLCIAELERRLQDERQITDVLRQLVADLIHEATHDSLTGLLNRAGWLRLMESRDATALILLDLDHFKQINDIYGHAAGDGVLTAVARRLDGLTPGRVARLGGDEFAILAERGEDPYVLASLVAGIIGDQPVTVTTETGPSMVRVAASIGWVHLADGVEVEVALRRADVALYHAKHHRISAPMPVGWREGMTMPQRRAVTARRAVRSEALRRREVRR